MGIRKASAWAAILGLVAAPAAAQSGWAGIGAAGASGDSGRVTIITRSDPRYRQLMICVEGHAVRLNDAQVRFSDNRIQNVRLRARLADGACSRMIDLSSHRQAIASADITYDVASLAGGTVRVQLFAR